MGRAGLHPTVITDVNGRVTTVHKKMDVPASGPKMAGLPAPVISGAMPTSETSATLLRFPTATQNQIDAFIFKHAEELGRRGYDQPALSIFESKTSRKSQGVIIRAVEERNVPIRAVCRFLTDSYSNKHAVAANLSDANEKGEKHLRTSVLLAETIVRECPQIVTRDGISLATLITRATVGYGYQLKQFERNIFTPIDTEEELASITAVTLFIARCYADGAYSNDYIKNRSFFDANDTQAQGVFIVNRSLDAYIRENPGRVDRICEYVRERGIGTTAKETQAMIKFLDESDEMGALGEGWL